MLIELLAQNNYGSYNIKLAQIVGLHSAIYLNELLQINEKAYRKGKLQENMFVVDRDYIKQRTTLDIKEQLDIEKTLKKLGILTTSNSGESNEIVIDISTLTTMLMSTDETLLKDMSKIVKKANPKTKKDGEIENLKHHVYANDINVLHAYYDWIEQVHPQKYMNQQTVEQAQQVINNVTHNNSEAVISILKIATANLYRDVTWAINIYNKNYQQNVLVKPPVTPFEQPNPTQIRKRLSNEVF